MPTLRGNVYYVKRNIPSVGQVYRSLGTRGKDRARKLEEMLVSLGKQGFGHLVRAWLEGRVDLHRLFEAKETDKLGDLIVELEERAREDPPLRLAIDEALRFKAPDVTQSTLARYQASAFHFLVYSAKVVGNGVSVRQALSTDLVQAFKGFRLGEGAARETVNNDLQALSILATHAIRNGWIDERPRIKRFETRVRIRYLERGDLLAYMAAVRSPFRSLFGLLIGTGLRLGEAERLTVQAVKFGSDGTRTLIEDAKTATGVRPVFVPRWAADALQEHIEEHGLEGSDRLFTIKRRTVQNEHGRACRIAGIPNYTIHDHRHTAAVAMARAGMPLDRIQRQLGHKHITMTMRYAAFHPDYNDVGIYFERAEEYLGLGTSTEVRSERSESAVEATEEGPDPGNSPGNTHEVAAVRVRA